MNDFDFKPKYISQTWGETYLIEPIPNYYYYIFVIDKDEEGPVIGHGGPTISPDDRFADRKPINNLFINPLVIAYINSHKEQWIERLQIIIKMKERLGE